VTSRSPNLVSSTSTPAAGRPSLVSRTWVESDAVTPENLRRRSGRCTCVHTHMCLCVPAHTSVLDVCASDEARGVTPLLPRDLVHIRPREASVEHDLLAGND